MPISDEKKLIFVHIPKNAGTSLEKQLNMRATGHKSWEIYRNFYSREWNSYTSFAIVRNPLDRLVSNYEYAKMEKSYWHSNDGKSIYGKHPDYELCIKHSFKEIVDLLMSKPMLFKHEGWKPQHIWICDKDFNIKVHHVIKYEEMNDKLKELNICEKLQTLNTSERKEYSLYYNDDLNKKVRSIYEIDFRLFYY